MAAEEAALGALLGACVGDAAGAVLEFMSMAPTSEEVDEALRMPGGGVWEVGPGQVTDDSELALCLAQALSPWPPSAKPPLDNIAFWYGRWMNSPPFDVGNTTRSALHTAGRHVAETGQPTPGLGLLVQKQAAKYNKQDSLSNGSLMRATPLAIWGHQLSTADLAAAARQEASLTHPNASAQDATAAYCIAVAHLINHPKDAAGAVAAAQAWLQEAGEPLVQTWLQEALQPGPGPAVHPMAGFARWGFVHAFRALHLQLPFLDALTQVLVLGGDTDTNAAIVGALVGAYHGANAIPSYMKDHVLSRVVGSEGQDRPDFLQTCLVPKLVSGLLRDEDPSL